MLYLPRFSKRCSKCKDVKLYNQFSKDRTHADGLHTRCSSCTAQSRKDNSEKLRIDRLRKYRENPQKGRDSSKRWRIRHPDKVKSNARQWQLNNPEKTREIMKRYRAKHPDKVRANNQNRKAKRRILAFNFSESNWNTALRWWDGVCAYCGHPPSFFDVYPTLHQDHFVPVVHGGGYTVNNILPACQFCNISKNDKEAFQWLADKFGKRKANKILKRVQDYFKWVKAQS